MRAKFVAAPRTQADITFWELVDRKKGKWAQQTVKYSLRGKGGLDGAEWVVGERLCLLMEYLESQKEGKVQTERYCDGELIVMLPGDASSSDAKAEDCKAQIFHNFWIDKDDVFEAAASLPHAEVRTYSRTYSLHPSSKQTHNTKLCALAGARGAWF